MLPVSACPEYRVPGRRPWRDAEDGPALYPLFPAIRWVAYPETVSCSGRRCGLRFLAGAIGPGPPNFQRFTTADG